MDRKQKRGNCISIFGGTWGGLEEHRRWNEGGFKASHTPSIVVVTRSNGTIGLSHKNTCHNEMIIIKAEFSLISPGPGDKFENQLPLT